MKIYKLMLLIILPVIGCQTGSKDQITVDDYKRAVSFNWSEIRNKQAFNLYVDTHWETDFLWFKNAGPNASQYVKVAFSDQVQSPLFNHDRMAEVLANQLEQEVSPDQLPIDQISIDEQGNLSIVSSQVELLLDINTLEEVSPIASAAMDDFSEVSPDGLWRAFSRDYNLFVENTTTGREKQLTYDGQKDLEYATWYGWDDIMVGETRDRKDRFNVRWTEDSRYIICNQVDLREADKMYLLDWSVDTLYRPRLLGYYRGSPGDESMVVEQPIIVNVNTGKKIVPDVGKRVHINGVFFRETHNPDLLLMGYQSRGYQNQYLKTLNLITGEIKTVYEETSATNIDNFRVWPIPGSPKWLLASERSGWRQLYVLDISEGELVPFTQGAYYVNDVLEVDETSKRIYFLASGKEAGANPYHQQLYYQALDEQRPTLLTAELLHHQVSLSVDQQLFVDNASDLQQPTVTLLRSLADGQVLDTLAQAELSKIKQKGWEPPLAFSTVARDGETTIYGAVWRPTNFDPGKSYPVIDHSYTGPHTQVFPRDFRRTLTVSNQALAELGFIVIMVDGLGSARRSKAFHDWSYKNLGGNLEDHVLWIRALASEYSWVNAGRVGIFGHSAGGYDAAHGLLAYPDFYDVGVASSADHDHRMEKAWWPEMYMGWPIDSAYHLQSNITMAGNLEGKLLITHGGIDENVNPSATFKLAEALVQADKPFDMKIFPSQRHGYRGAVGDYFTKLRWNYFVEHLRGVEPLWEIELHPDEAFN